MVILRFLSTIIIVFLLLSLIFFYLQRFYEVEQTDHGPKVVGHLLAILQHGPEEEVSPGVFTALLQLGQVLLGVEQSTLCWLFLENIGPMIY